MSTRSVLTVVGGVVGAYFGYPQLGLVVGSLVGGAVDPQRIEGPQINETGVQTSAEGVQRPIVWGTIDVTGNIMHKGPSVKTTTEESQGKGGGAEVTTNHIHRSYAIRICEGPIAAVLRIWADNKLVYDMRAGSAMVPESQQWIANKVIYFGDETQTPDPTLVGIDADAPSHRGTAYIVFILEDLTERAGSISQYRFEVAKEVSSTVGAATIGPDNGAFVTDINYDDNGNLLMLRDQGGTGSGPEFGVGYPGSFTVATYYRYDINTQLDTQVIANGGDALDPGSDQRMGVIAISPDNKQIGGGSLGTNATFNRLLVNGVTTAHLVDENGQANWNLNDYGGGTPPLYGGGVFFRGNFVYQAVNRSTLAKMTKHLTTMGGDVYPMAYVNDPFGAGVGFYMHVSRAGNVRIMSTSNFTSIREYDDDLVFTGTRTGPSVSAVPGGVYGFGVDEDKGLIAIVYMPTGATLKVDVFDMSNNLLVSVPLGAATGTLSKSTKVLFTDENIFVMRNHQVYSVDAPNTFQGVPAVLSDVVSDIYERCGIDDSMFDVSELTDEVDGLVCANAYTGADAITKLIQAYWFDISGHDRKNWHPKRGGAVIETLTINELLELPDTNTREQAIERPKKLHLRYKHAGSGYAAVKATAPRANSPDVLTTGEAIIELPIVMDENIAARKADVMYKIASTEVSGETELVVPFRIGAKYVTGNALGLSLRNQTTRQRVDRIEFQPWRIKLTLKPDRQSAYTSNLTGVPIPAPELPPSTIVGETELAVLDIPARTDSEDDLNYLVAVSGSLPPWYGARYQRSLDGGSTYTSVLDIRTASIMGELQANVTAASEHFTDTTNVLQVRLFREGQTLESITDEEFLSEGNPCAVENADGSWELMQFREAVQVSDGTWELSILQRGQLASGGSAHLAGARFVMLQRPSHIAASSSWLNADLTHRAISLGESADDTDNDETHTYVGRSQQEWAPAYLEVTRDVSTDILTANWVRRGRFGTAFAPVLSANYLYDTITFDDGTTSVSFNTTAGEYTYDASALGPSVTVTVTPFNRITGNGPSSSETV